MFMRKKREGFTLVELLIVMAVIAALMGALVPVAISAINHANATRVAENLQSLVTQVQQYAYSNHTIPSTSELANSVSGGNLGDYAIYSTSASTQIKFAVFYNKSISASDVNKVWKSAQASSTINGWLGIKSSTPDEFVGATGVIAIYW